MCQEFDNFVGNSPYILHKDSESNLVKVFKWDERMRAWDSEGSIMYLFQDKSDFLQVTCAEFLCTAYLPKDLITGADKAPVRGAVTWYIKGKPFRGIGGTPQALLKCAEIIFRRI